MPCQLDSAQSQLSGPRGKNPFHPVAATMLQLRNVLCCVHVGQHCLPLQRQTTGMKAPRLSLYMSGITPNFTSESNDISKRLVKEQTLFNAESYRDVEV